MDKATIDAMKTLGLAGKLNVPDVQKAYLNARQRNAAAIDAAYDTLMRVLVPEVTVASVWLPETVEVETVLTTTADEPAKVKRGRRKKEKKS